jgi:hypothetical protein
MAGAAASTGAAAAAAAWGTRLLVALPLLLIAESIVSLSLKVQTHHLLTMGVISESDREHYRKLQARAMAFRDSLPLEAILMLIAWTTAVLLRTVVHLRCCRRCQIHTMEAPARGHR